MKDTTDILETDFKNIILLARNEMSYQIQKKLHCGNIC